MKINQYWLARIAIIAVIALTVFLTRLQISLNTEPQTYGAAAPVEPHYRAAKVLRVIDGDTIEAELAIASKAELGSEFLLRTSCRLYGINAPDTHPDGEAKTKAASDNLRKLIAANCKDGAFQAELKGRDKYGRTLLILWIQGISLNQRMVDEGFAGVYLP